MEMEIESLLKRLLDINESMSRCVAAAASTASLAQKLARHREILHDFSQVTPLSCLSDTTSEVFGRSALRGNSICSFTNSESFGQGGRRYLLFGTYHRLPNRFGQVRRDLYGLAGFVFSYS